jgi:hypothetical protein
MKHIILIALIFTITFLGTNHLPYVFNQIRRGQMIILNEAKSPKWGKAWIPLK